MQPRIEVLSRDWKSVANPKLAPIAIFAIALGTWSFKWLIIPIALGTFAAVAGLGAVLAFAQVRQLPRTGVGAMLNGAIGRRAGRLRVDAHGVAWWPYADRHGAPELAVPWEKVDTVTIQPVAAVVPRCRLRVNATEFPVTGFEMSMSTPRLRRLLGEVVNADGTGD